MSEEIKTLPIAGRQIGPVSAMKAVILRLDFLAHPMQSEPSQSPTFVMSVQQARELAQALTKHAELASSGEPEGTGLPKH